MMTYDSCELVDVLHAALNLLVTASDTNYPHHLPVSVVICKLN